MIELSAKMIGLYLMIKLWVALVKVVGTLLKRRSS
jgi:hypothetical protein